jgi:biopolymer transport protein ExbB
MNEVLGLVSDFLETGGDVLWVIFVTSILLWSLILERFLFMKKTFPQLREKVISSWSERTEHKSWSAHRIREAQLSIMRMALNKNISNIKVLVALCPLLGLLGTVTGMISVFDVMAITGTGNARLMASGISMATIPTMAGMVAALSGLYFGSYFENKSKNLFNRLSDELTFEEGVEA